MWIFLELQFLVSDLADFIELSVFINASYLKYIIWWRK